MPQTPSAIANFSPGRAGHAAAKARSQPSKDVTKTFASLLGIEKPAKANSISKKLRCGEASSSAKADEDGAASSQIASDEAVNNTSDRNVASIASISNPVQFVPGGLMLTFASCIPISGAGKDVSVSRNPGADSSLAMQASGPTPQPSHLTKGYYGSGTQAFNITPAANAARSPKALAAFPSGVVTKSRETPLAPDPGLPASDAGNNSDQKIAAAVPSSDPNKVSAPAVVLSSKTHFVPEALHSAVTNSVAAQMATGASRQDQAEAAGQVAISFSQKQRISELSTAATPDDEVPPKIVTPVLAPGEFESLQPRDFTQARTKATSQAAQRLDTITDGSAVAEGHAGNPTYTVSAPEQSATPSKRGGSSPDTLARDTASHGSASSGAAPTPAEAPRSFEVSSAIELASVGASAAPLAQQILVGIQRAIPAADNSQTSPGALQPTLDGQQQPLKTITVALSPASLGNVAVELSLNSGRLGVKLQVEEPATVQLLRQDGSLEKLLESAGYAVQSLSIHLSPQPNQPIQGQTTPNGQGFSNQFSPAGGGQEQGHSQSHKGQPEDRNADQKPGYGRAEDVRGGGSLYV